MSHPFTCDDGCHGGDFPDFDHFCDALDVTEDETPYAFAAWLGNKTEWDGEYGRVADNEANSNKKGTENGPRRPHLRDDSESS